MKQIWYIFRENALEHTMDFEGRLGRKPYLVFLLVTLALIILATGTECLLWQKVTETASPLVLTVLVVLGVVLLGIILIMLIQPLVAAIVRRLHDVGCSGWVVFLAFIPLGLLVVLVLTLLKASTRGDKYGTYTQEQ